MLNNDETGQIDVIADNTFYSCFLTDINDPKPLIKIMKSNYFLFVFGPILRQELEKNVNYPEIRNCLNSIKKDVNFNVGELLLPFLGKKEIEKGEHEAIGIAYVFYNQGKEFILIIDDNAPRNLILKKMSFLLSKMIGTVKFMELCTCKYCIFSTKEAIDILKRIKISKFRVPDEVVDEIIDKLRRGCYYENCN